MPEPVWNEKPRCSQCGHRRIHHFRGIAGNAVKGIIREYPVRCSMPRCGCPEYIPVDMVTPSATVSAADTASRDAHHTGVE